MAEEERCVYLCEMFSLDCHFFSLRIQNKNKKGIEQSKRKEIYKCI